MTKKKRFYLSQCTACGASFNETYDMCFGDYDERDGCCENPCPIYNKTEPMPYYVYLEVEKEND